MDCNNGVRKGPWNDEEDEKLVSYISRHGHGHWEILARKSGLKRTGKSCRLRWLNYLRPGLRRGNLSLDEQLKILQLHCQWGNRWAKIAEHLPGRSDNEIKNYWRTRVQKQAKQLELDMSSHRFKETMHHVWMPRLQERIQADAASMKSFQTSQATECTDEVYQWPCLKQSTTTTYEEDSLQKQRLDFNLDPKPEHAWLNILDDYCMENPVTDADMMFLHHHLNDD